MRRIVTGLTQKEIYCKQKILYSVMIRPKSNRSLLRRIEVGDKEYYLLWSETLRDNCISGNCGENL